MLITKLTLHLEYFSETKKFGLCPEILYNLIIIEQMTLVILQKEHSFPASANIEIKCVGWVV